MSDLPEYLKNNPYLMREDELIAEVLNLRATIERKDRALREAEDYIINNRVRPKWRLGGADDLLASIRAALGNVREEKAT